MISTDIGKQLHDKATRSETLSDEEQAQLESWYALQDNVENNILRVTGDEKALVTVQAQIDAVLTRLTITTKRIQEITSENKVSRQEIAVMRRQLASSSPHSKLPDALI